jgi:hypothetical protein
VGQDGRDQQHEQHGGNEHIVAARRSSASRQFAAVQIPFDFAIRERS